MGILLGFLPFLVFAGLAAFAGPTIGLAAGALTSAVLSIRTRLAHQSLKVLEVGTFVLFTALAAYTALSSAKLSIIQTRLIVDGGLCAIVLLSIAFRRPFTIQYAREQVPQQYWSSPTFKRTNYIISAAWAAAFAIMLVAEAALVFAPNVPRSVGIGVIVAALVGAAFFTSRFTKASPSPSE